MKIYANLLLLAPEVCIYIRTSYITRNLAMAAVCKVSFHDSLNTTPFEGKAMHTTCQLCNHVTFQPKDKA